MEDRYLLHAAREAGKEGYLSVEETHRALGFEAPAEADKIEAPLALEE